MNMKTAISIPDPVFAAAERLAKRLGISRSRLYATAVDEYVRAHRDETVTAQLDAVYADQESALDPELLVAQLASLPADDWSPRE